jgi:hypothetical protein
VIEADSHAITSPGQLWELVGEPLPRVLAKEVRALDERAQDFIAKSPFLVMATTGAGGHATPPRRAARQVSCKS